jgi:hypothetical protein
MNRDIRDPGPAQAPQNPPQPVPPKGILPILDRLLRFAKDWFKWKTEHWFLSVVRIIISPLVALALAAWGATSFTDFAPTSLADFGSISLILTEGGKLTSDYTLSVNGELYEPVAAKPGHYQLPRSARGASVAVIHSATRELVQRQTLGLHRTQTFEIPLHKIAFQDKFGSLKGSFLLRSSSGKEASMSADGFFRVNHDFCVDPVKLICAQCGKKIWSGPLDHALSQSFLRIPGAMVSWPDPALSSLRVAWPDGNAEVFQKSTGITCCHAHCGEQVTIEGNGKRKRYRLYGDHFEPIPDLTKI